MHFHGSNTTPCEHDCCIVCGTKVEVTDDPLSVMCVECQQFDPPGYT